MARPKENFDFEKKQAMKIAKDLFYEAEVLEKIRNAKSSYEIERILIKARKKQEEF